MKKPNTVKQINLHQRNIMAKQATIQATLFGVNKVTITLIKQIKLEHNKFIKLLFFKIKQLDREAVSSMVPATVE